MPFTGDDPGDLNAAGGANHSERPATSALRPPPYPAPFPAAEEPIPPDVLTMLPPGVVKIATTWGEVWRRGPNLLSYADSEKSLYLLLWRWVDLDLSGREIARLRRRFARRAGMTLPRSQTLLAHARTFDFAKCVIEAAHQALLTNRHRIVGHPAADPGLTAEDALGVAGDGRLDVIPDRLCDVVRATIHPRYRTRQITPQQVRTILVKSRVVARADSKHGWRAWIAGRSWRVWRITDPDWLHAVQMVAVLVEPRAEPTATPSPRGP
jgi:hypothetical protein